MNDPKKFGKIMIIVGVIILIVFIVLVVLSRSQNKPILSNDGTGLLPNPFPGLFLATPKDNNQPIGSVDVTPVEPGIVVVPEDPLVQLTDFPVTGYRLVTDSVTNSSSVILNDKELGYIYHVSGDENPVLRQDTATFVSGVGDIDYGSEGEVFMRYWDSVNYRYEGFFGGLNDSLTGIQCPVQFTGSLKVGATGREVEQLQYYLNTYLGTSVEVTPGQLDEATKQLVISFQKNQKLTADGSFGPGSQKAFMAICREIARTAKADEMAKTKQPRFTLSGSPQLGEMHTVITSPEMSKLFYIKMTANGVRGYVRGLSPIVADKEIYKLPFVEWKAAWPTENTITLQTKPAATVPGYLYYLDVATGKMSRILSNVLGLTTEVAPNLTSIIAGRSTESQYVTALIETSGQAQPVVRNLDIVTFPEKCTWKKDSTEFYCMAPEYIPAGSYPDDWYQNLVTFSDRLWKVNARTLNTELVDQFGDDTVPKAFDAVELQLSVDNRYLYFIDQVTGFLWRYNLQMRSR